MIDADDYVAFKCAKPLEREAMKRTPIYYPREQTFNVVNLLCIAGSFAAGWVGGNVLRVVLA